MTPYHLFNDAHPTRAQITGTAQKYVGMPYSVRNARAIFNAETGRMEGQTDCLRLLLFIARDLGYLAPDFDVNLSRPQPKLSRDEAMWELLRENLDEISLDEIKPGDILLFIYSDVNADLVAVHHVGMQTSSAPFPRGSFIHSEDFERNGSGCVAEVRMDGLQWSRVVSAWRLRGIVEESQIEYSKSENHEAKEEVSA